MKKMILPICALLAFFMYGEEARPLACAPVADPERLEVRDPALFAELDARASARRNAVGRFWRIEKPGTPPSYIVGSNHFEQLDDQSPHFQALEQTRFFYREVTQRDSEAFFAAQREDPDLVVRDPPQPLEEVLPADIAEKLAQAWIAQGEPEWALGFLRPWFLYFALRAGPCSPHSSMELEAKGMDVALEEHALRLRLPIRSLETWPERLDAIMPSIEEPPYLLLRGALAHSDPAADFEMLSLFAEERVMLAYEYLAHRAIERAGPDVPLAEAYERFWREAIVGRNRSMVEKSLPELEKGGVFIVVGAYHLPTKDGVIALLEDQGFTATRLRDANALAAR